MRRKSAPRPHKRDGTWYLVRRVPKEFEDLDRRGIVRMSTGIAVADDPRALRAKAISERLDAELHAYWRDMRDGQSTDARLRFEAAQRRARSLGLEYRTAQQIADGDLSDLLHRLKILDGQVSDPVEVAAVFGGESLPTLQVADLVAEFENLQSSGLRGMSKEQIVKWRNPKERAMRNLIAAIGNKNIVNLIRSDALSFRRWWQQKIEREDLDVGTANKDFGHISKMLRTIDMAHDLGLKPVFSHLKLEGEVEKSRTAFAAEFVQQEIINSGVLSGLNDEAFAIIWLMADTGLRLSEACNLTADTIKLNAEVPHIQVRPDGRKMKTPHSARDIPLVGTALAVAKLMPDGFPRYRDKAASLSALINKAMKTHRLLPTDGHSLYSLRHTFEDRLTAVEAPEKVVASLMGHKWHRPRYGEGPSLKQKQGWLERIAYAVPPVRR